MYIFEQNGVDIGTYNEDYMMKQGTYVARDQLQKGDLFSLIAQRWECSKPRWMYMGDNKVIHMADPKQDIVISDLDSKPYYKDNYITARRVLPTLLSANPATPGDKIVEKAFSLKSKVNNGKYK